MTCRHPRQGMLLGCVACRPKAASRCASTCAEVRDDRLCVLPRMHFPLVALAAFLRDGSAIAHSGQRYVRRAAALLPSTVTALPRVSIPTPTLADYLHRPGHLSRRSVASARSQSMLPHIAAMPRGASGEASSSILYS